MPRRACTICQHEERARAELLLAAGGTVCGTARKLGMSEDALERHWKRHVPEEHRKALKPGADALAARLELSGQIAEENTSSLEHLKAARAVLWQMLVEERSKRHTVPAVMVAGQYTKVCNMIAKLTGELAHSPLVQTTTINVHFTQNPEFQALMEDVAAALEPYPEARRAVFDRFAALEQQPDDRIIDVPALVHHADAAAA